MKSILIIPAAGLGTRMMSSIPKILIHVNGRPMIDYLFDLYAEIVERFILVLHPSFEKQVVAYCDAHPYQIDYVVQDSPTGMLDAILLSHDHILRYQPTSIWITWCDQIAIHPKTIMTLVEMSNQCPDTSLIFPTTIMAKPYIHFVRNEQSEITNVLHQREKDTLPEVGESDMGLFCLSYECYSNMLVEFSNDAGKGTATQERNFLTFIPWLQGKTKVHTFPGHDKYESLGINTREDLYKIENYLGNQKQ